MENAKSKTLKTKSPFFNLKKEDLRQGQVQILKLKCSKQSFVFWLLEFWHCLGFRTLILGFTAQSDGMYAR